MKINKRTAIFFGIFFVLFFMAIGNAAAVSEEGTETQITTNKSEQFSPAIYEERIVWADYRNDNGSYTNSDIYMYDLSTSTETQITTNGSNQIWPDIYGDVIVWMDDRNENWDIYMYDLSTSTETQITTNESNQSGSDIYEDRIVWLDDRNSGSVPDDGFGGFDVYMYNLSTKKETRITKSTISINPDYGASVNIYDNKIVCDMGPYGISVYDLSTRQENVISDLQLYNLAISGNRIVGTTDREGREGAVYMYDLSTATKTKITADFSAYGGPDISGNRIVWPDLRNSGHPSGLDLYMYDLSTSTESRITTSKSVAWSVPSIYGNRIVWQDERNGSDIYMFTLASDEVPEPPVADFSANITEGYVPLSVQFTDLSENATEWNWDFGDGATSIEQSPVYTYSAAGNYTVSLTVSNSNGTDSKIATINVLDPEQEVGPLKKIAFNVEYNSNPVWSPDGNEILFTRSDGLYKVSSDGSGEIRLISANASTNDKISGYSWSPDGSKVSYIRNGFDDLGWPITDVWLINSDGTEKFQLLDTKREADMWFYSYAWFPSGSKIVYSYTDPLDGYGSGIWVINSDGSNNQEFFGNWEPISGMVFSPDGSKLVYHYTPDPFAFPDPSLPQESSYFGILDLDQGSVTKLSPDKSSPVWSPDSSMIGYHSNGNIYTIKADGTGETQLTAEAANENSPVFSPDGSKIVFVSDENGNNDILVTDADGNNNVHLTTNTASDEYPVWNPGGTKIAFWSDREGDSGIYILTLKAPLLAFPGYTNPPTDLDQNGLYEDINGNGILDFDDVVAYYDNMEWIEENVPLEFFDYNSNGLIDFDDVVKLYDML